MLLLLFSVFALCPCRAAFLDVSKYKVRSEYISTRKYGGKKHFFQDDMVPVESWVEENLTTFRALSAMDCVVQALGRGKFSYNFEPAQKTCKVGTIDLATAATTSIKEHVTLQGRTSFFCIKNSLSPNHCLYCNQTLGKVPW